MPIYVHRKLVNGSLHKHMSLTLTHVPTDTFQGKTQTAKGKTVRKRNIQEEVLLKTW